MSNLTPHMRYQAHLSRTPSPNKDPDAGLKEHGHYERRLPKWRFRLRQKLIPVVRWETPHLAQIQSLCRSASLDTYFAFTANLGTHTFFMTALPICFWCGYPDSGIALAHMLAMGVYLSGFSKDLVCLPRPLSPPLQRITMSGSAALEYGFPSTHTTNAVSVALYCFRLLSNARNEYHDLTYILLCALCFVYVASITLGRMYCGMHGFFDVVFGGVLGALIAWVRIFYGPALDNWILSDGWSRPAMAVAVLAIAIRIYPEPADNCPCFDDSVAFLGVVMGVEIGTWHNGLRFYDEGSPPSLAKIYHFANRNLLVSAARIAGGIVVVFVWRAVMKPLLLRILPPIFRFVDQRGLRLPRRYFLQSNQYKIVPPLRRDDNVIPPMSEIPEMVSHLRHPRQRTVSVGPQSEADAREYMANREQKRRNSRSEPRHTVRRPRELESRAALPTPSSIDDDALRNPMTLGETLSANNHDVGSLKARSGLRAGPPDPNLLTPSPSEDEGVSDGEDAKQDREMLSHLEKPRIRYDVEVVTKLVVYAGIAWWAVEGNLLWFQAVGLV